MPVQVCGDSHIRRRGAPCASHGVRKCKFLVGLEIFPLKAPSRSKASAAARAAVPVRRAVCETLSPQHRRGRRGASARTHLEQMQGGEPDHAHRMTATLRLQRHSTALSPSDERGGDVGRGEIIAFVEQRYVHALCQGVGGAIADVQAGGMAALSERLKGSKGELALRVVERDDLDFGTVDEVSQRSQPIRTTTRRNDDAGFEQRHRGDHLALSVSKEVAETSFLRLIEQDREQCRGIDDNHSGTPYSL